jgi:hypothetical protein
MEYAIGGDPRVASTSYLPGEAIDGTDLVLSYERKPGGLLMERRLEPASPMWSQ